MPNQNSSQLLVRFQGKEFLLDPGWDLDSLKFIGRQLWAFRGQKPEFEVVPKHVQVPSAKRVTQDELEKMLLGKKEGKMGDLSDTDEGAYEAKDESAWDALATSEGVWESAYEAVDEAGPDDNLGAKKDDEDDVDFMNRLNQRLGLGKTDPKKPYHYLKGPWEPGKDKGDAGPDAARKVYGTIPKGGVEPENPTDPKNTGGKSRYRAQDAGGKLPIDFQDYDGPVHPHLQKARDTMRQGLGWSVDQIRKAVPNLDKFANQPKSSKPAGQSSTSSHGMMPGPGGQLYHTGAGKDDDDKAIPGTPGSGKAAQHKPIRTGVGGYWELARLTKELEAIPDLPSDKAMTRLQTVSNDLHKLKLSLKKNPTNDPDLEKAYKGVEAALTGIPGIMKAAGTLAKSPHTDKGLWQRKMTSKPGDEPEIPMDKRPGMSQGDLNKAAGAAWRPKGQIIHPTGQDPKMPPTKADKEKAKQATVQQRVQPQVRKAGEKEPDKGPVKPTIPAAAVARAQPTIRKAADKKPDDDSKLAKGGEEHPANKGGEKKDGEGFAPWRALKRMVGMGDDKKDDAKDDKKEPEKKDDDKKESAGDEAAGPWKDAQKIVGGKDVESKKDEPEKKAKGPEDKNPITKKDGGPGKKPEPKKAEKPDDKGEEKKDKKESAWDSLSAMLG